MLNARYQDTIERLTKERDELRAELLLMRQQLDQPDEPITRPGTRIRP